MKYIFIYSFIFSALTNFCFGQQENIYLKGGLANFDDTDGFNISISYNRELNRYLDFEVNLSYAKSTDFPSKYKFSNEINKNYWYSKSNIYGINSLLNIVFIREQKHYFSLYGGVGFMFIDTVDSSNSSVSHNEFNYQSTIESQTVLSKSIGFKYIFYVNKLGLGLDANLLSPIKNNDSYFGQDNYRSINLIFSKRF